MYEAFFGLRERPFDLTTNPRFLFLTPRHREALSTLRYGLSAPRGLTTLVGDAGTGKTTVLRAALNEERRTENRHVLLTNPTLTRSEFYEFIARGFRLSEDCARSKARFLTEFQRDVQERHLAGGVTTLIIDEAQSLPYELLEEVRLLANIETSTVKLLNLVLVGQPELSDRLNEQSLRQLKQRITLRAHLQPLDLRETASYVAGRLRIAGGNVSEILTREAVVAIHEISTGLPRIINVLSDNALMNGFALQSKPVDADIVREIGRDFDFGRPPAANRAAPGRPAAPAAAPRGGSHLAIGPGPERMLAEPLTDSLDDEVDDSDLPAVAQAVGESAAAGAIAPMPRKRRFLFF
jgi:general secretion pathway protein A